MFSFVGLLATVSFIVKGVMLKTSIRNYIEYFPPAVEYAGDDHMLILVMMYFLSEDVKSSGSVQMKIIGG